MYAIIVQGYIFQKTEYVSSLVLRHVHTNALQCALDQIASNRFELIRIRSIHTLFTESEFNCDLCKLYCVGQCGNMKIYLDIYCLGYDNAAELQYSFFIAISIVYVMQ